MILYKHLKKLFHLVLYTHLSIHGEYLTFSLMYSFGAVKKQVLVFAFSILTSRKLQSYMYSSGNGNPKSKELFKFLESTLCPSQWASAFLLVLGLRRILNGMILQSCLFPSTVVTFAAFFKTSFKLGQKGHNTLYLPCFNCSHFCVLNYFSN